MAVNKPTGDNARKGAVKKRSQTKSTIGGASAWTKRDRKSGEFMAVKRPGKKKKTAKKFKGVRVEKKKAAKKRTAKKTAKKEDRPALGRVRGTVKRFGVDRRFINLGATLVPYPDIVPALREFRFFCADAMRDKLRVLLRLASGYAWMSDPVMGGNRAGKIEERTVS